MWLEVNSAYVFEIWQITRQQVSSQWQLDVYTNKNSIAWIGLTIIWVTQPKSKQTFMQF